MQYENSRNDKIKNIIYHASIPKMTWLCYDISRADKKHTRTRNWHGNNTAKQLSFTVYHRKYWPKTDSRSLSLWWQNINTNQNELQRNHYKRINGRNACCFDIIFHKVDKAALWSSRYGTERIEAIVRSRVESSRAKVKITVGTGET